MMGGGAGHIFDMIPRLKANEAIRKKRIHFFQKGKTILKATVKRKVRFKKPTKEALIAIRLKTRENTSRERLKESIEFLLTLLIVGGLFWVLFSWVSEKL